MPPTNLIEDLLRSLGGDITIGYCAPQAVEKLDSLALPTWLYRLLRFNWLTSSEGVCRYYIESVADILKHDDLARCVAAGMLPIGSAPNGDPIVIRFSEISGEVGMLSHEEVGEEAGLSEHYFQVTSTIEEFFLRAVDGLYLPCDSFAAREFSRLQASMRGPAGT